MPPSLTFDNRKAVRLRGAEVNPQGVQLVDVPLYRSATASEGAGKEFAARHFLAAAAAVSCKR